LVNNSYGPLINALPLSLADKTFKSPAREGDDGGIKVEKRLEDEYGFAHPAISRPQRTVWIPRDADGVAKSEEEASRAAGVHVSSEGATVDERGNVDITAPPPDELWEVYPI
jgi:hypothetical protein